MGWLAHHGTPAGIRGSPSPEVSGGRAVALVGPSGENLGVITGFNSDVKYRGQVYHVQTEDKGTDNPLIETLIYKGGEILASRRLPYKDLIEGDNTEAAISHLMEEQHNTMILEVKRGAFTPAAEVTWNEDLSLDEIVLTFLAARVAK
jgi:hypothetical protein